MKPLREIIHRGEKYYLDLHSTILSRKLSNHLLFGRLRYVSPKIIGKRREVYHGRV